MPDAYTIDLLLDLLKNIYEGPRESVFYRLPVHGSLTRQDVVKWLAKPIELAELVMHLIFMEYGFLFFICSRFCFFIFGTFFQESKGTVYEREWECGCM